MWSAPCLLDTLLHCKESFNIKEGKGRCKHPQVVWAVINTQRHMDEYWEHQRKKSW